MTGRSGLLQVRSLSAEMSRLPLAQVGCAPCDSRQMVYDEALRMSATSFGPMTGLLGSRPAGNERENLETRYLRNAWFLLAFRRASQTTWHLFDITHFR
jgi:hypothetical protein